MTTTERPTRLSFDLKDSNKKKSSNEEEDAALTAAEESFLEGVDEDEEVASYDEMGKPIVDTINLEDRMMTVAIARSVAETSSKPPAKIHCKMPEQPNCNNSSSNVSSSLLQPAPSRVKSAHLRRTSSEPSSSSLSLTPKPVPQPLSVPSCSSSLLRKPPLTSTISHNNKTIPRRASELTRRMSINTSKPRTTITPYPSTIKPTSVTSSSSSIMPSRPIIAKRNQQQHLQIKPQSLSVPNPLAHLSSASHSSIKIQPIKQNHASRQHRPQHHQQQHQLPSSSSSSSPSSTAPPPPPAPSVPCPLSNSVPCPLPAPTPAATVSATITQSTPSPLDGQQQQQQQPEQQQPEVMKRGRIFSIDIDPAGFDFPDMKIDNLIISSSSPSPPTFSSPPLPPIVPSNINVKSGDDQQQRAPSTNQSNSGSVQVGPTMDINASNVVTSAANAARDRAMSFEFFSLGISADESLPELPLSSSLTTLPPPVASTTAPAPSTTGLPPLPVPVPSSISSVVTRPRGDSIIFDPISFQDGGIHEEKALGRRAANTLHHHHHPTRPGEASTTTAAAAASIIDMPSRDEMEIMNAPGFHPTPALLPSSLHAPGNTHPSAFAAAATLPGNNNNKHAVPRSTAAAASTSSTSLQMDLLNKDGRIGIYLPEARKARIAKFHSKRKMRIWRKRIKYDCRKKLADSRPRVKGRFVKRSSEY